MTPQEAEQVDPRAALWMTATLDRPTEPVSARTDAICALLLAVTFAIAAVGALVEQSTALAALCCLAAAAMFAYSAHEWRQ